MKKVTVFPIAILMLACMSLLAHAQQIASTAPRTISYQGYLVDVTKEPLTGNHKITITLYDSPVEGLTIHSESFTSAFDAGVFSVLIGASQPLESSLHFDRQYWVGISVDDGAELAPRTTLSSVPYALHADAASSLSKGASGAVTTLNGRSGDVSIKGGEGTLVEASGNTITITAIPQNTTGDIRAQATTVNSITGTANQVLANGTSGSKQSGDVTLTLPQNINTAASPTFNNATLTSMGSAGVVHNNAAGTLSTSLITNADVAAGAAISASKLDLTNGITSGDIVAGTIVNSDISAGAAIAASKLNLTNAITSGDIVAGTIVNSDINNGAAIAASKLNLANAIVSGDIAAGTIVNSDINAAAGITYGKLNLTGGIVNNDIAAGANIAGSKINLTNSITSGDIVSGTIVNSDINAGAAIAASKLNLANAITSGDIAAGTIVNSDINGAAAIAYSKLNLAGSITNTDISGGAAIAYSKLNLTANIVNNDIAAGANIAASKINLANAITTGDIAAGTILNSDINAAAGITYGKLNLNGSIVNTDIAGGAAIADTKLATISSAGKVSNSATTATSANTNNAIVARDASGNFSAGTITATLSGNATNVSGTITEAHGGTNTTTYTKGDILYASNSNTLSKRAIGATGQVLTIVGGVPVWSALSGVGVTSAQGTANQVLVNGGSGSQITGGITLTLPQNIHNGASPTFTGMTLSGLNTPGVVHNSSAGILSTSLIADADVAANAAIADTKLGTITTAGKVLNSATTATNLNTINAIVARDASGNFNAGTINATALDLTGQATSALTLDTDPANTIATKSYVDDIAVEYWSVTGNSGLIPGTNFFGTTDLSDLSFRTNNLDRLRLTSAGSILFADASGSITEMGSGTRMMWLPASGSIRAGQATGSEWNPASVGAQSVAMGMGTQASGPQSVAMGYYSTAYGMGSTAMGSATSAAVDGATAFGSASQAVGINSVAMGDNTTANGVGSVALGSNSTANGLFSTAMGSHTTAIGDYSFAIGENTNAGTSVTDLNNNTVITGNYSIALGRGITTGSSTFAYNSGSNTINMDISALSGVAYFGDVDLMIGNDDNSPRSLKFYGPNNMTDLSGSHFSSFTAAQNQSADIAYTLPATLGGANSLMTSDANGVMSWSSVSSLNIPTGSGSANSIALWSSSSSLGSASNLYYNSNSLGIGVSNPSQALDVSGNANFSGTITSGSVLTTNGIVMSGGSTVLSYSDVAIATDGSITIPNVSVVNIQDDGTSRSNNVIMPGGTNGQIIYIYNNDGNATSGAVTINANSMGVFVYIGGWKKAN